MKNKLLFWMLVMLCVSVGSALAYTSFTQPLSTNRQTNDSLSSMIMTFPALSGATIQSNCTMGASSYFLPLMDTETHHIWIEMVGQLNLYDTNCTLIHEEYVNGTVWGSGTLWDWDNDGLPNILFTVKTPDLTISIQSFELNGTSLINDKNIDMGAGVTSCTGVYCDKGFSNYCTVFCSDANIKKINITTGSYTNLASVIGNYSFSAFSGELGLWSGQSADYNPFKGALSGGDVDADGHTEIVFYDQSYYGSAFQTYWEFALYDIVDDVVQSNKSGYSSATSIGYQYGGGCAGSSGVAFVGSPIYIAKIGNPVTSNPKIILRYSGRGNSVGCSGTEKLVVYDANWNILYSPISGATLDLRVSNIVNGDYDGDGQYEFCSVSAGKLHCYEPSYSESFVCNIATYNGTGDVNKQLRPTTLSMFDYSQGGDMEFVTRFGIMDGDCTKLYDFGLNSTIGGGIVPVDFTNDGKYDYIQNDFSNTRLFSTGAGVPVAPTEGCTRAGCTSTPCIFNEDFTYECTLQSMNWTTYPPNPTLAPTAGQACYNPSPSGVFWLQYLLTPFLDEQIISDEFDMTVTTGVTPEHEFVYLDSDTAEYKKTVHLMWWTYNGTNYLSRYETVNGSYQSYDICTNCWNLSQKHHYNIVQYHQETGGDVFFNQTTMRLEPILPNTFALMIDSNTNLAWYNMPIYQQLNYSHTNLLNDVTWMWYNENVCVDNIKVYEGKTFSQGNWSPSCTYNPPTYSFPSLWVDFFQYPDEITDFGWIGYPFVIGDNPVQACNILFYDINDYTGEITHSLTNAQYQDFKMEFDLMPDSTIGNTTTYAECGSPVLVNFYDSANTLAFWVGFTGGTPDDDGYCNITSDSQIAYHNIGKWDGGALNSYKIDVHFDNQTFDFYYTTQDNPYSYLLGEAGIEFKNNVTNIKKFGWQPIMPQQTYQNGFWLDTISVVQTEGVVPANQTNFCYFDGCIYHDHFDYDDAVENHGWYLFNITPSDSTILFSANPYGYYLDHNFDTFRNTDGDGIISFQWRGMIGVANDSLNSPHFTVWSADLSKRPIDIEFDLGQVIDHSGVGGSRTLGTYIDNQWYTFTIVLDMNSNTFDFYLDTSKLGEGLTIDTTQVSTAVGKAGWHTVNNPITIDFLTVAEGDGLVEEGVSGDTGIPSEHLRSCWSKNGTFDWNCCSAEEKADRSLLCPTKVTMLFGLASLTSFVLGNILYFIVLVILFVIAMPFIVPAVRGR